MVLFLSDVSGSEIFVILFFVLIFFGSKSIPGIARSLGRTMRQIREASQDLQDEIRKSGADIKKDLNLDQLIDDTTRDIKKPFQNYARELDEAVNDNGRSVGANGVSFEPPKIFEMPDNPFPVRTPEIPRGEDIFPAGTENEKDPAADKTV